MRTILDDATTWFLESSCQSVDGSLVIRLAEGIKGKDRLPVQVGEQILGPYFPVTIESVSRVVEVRFANALAFLSLNESYDMPDPTLQVDDRSNLRAVADSRFRQYLAANTSSFELGPQPLTEWLLWTENQLIQVLCSGEPEVIQLNETADLSIHRYPTWYAN